ncbi:hypothetical protein KI688_004625 [Linnemannia hyalina]|uniref:Myb-like domain-containing protein n=1 Tax=Linnemannia hyalina TaxID=64524 RepID=A0A9P8BP70_9FUNG|nr:hypothetical protein KI688_004625 [Linnemannia hyalina]
MSRAISTTKNNASNTSTLLATDTPIIERVPAFTPITPVTPNTFKPFASPAKQTRGKWTLESNSVLVELAEAGMSWARISRVTGSARTTCLQHYKKYLAPFNAMAPQGSRTGAEAGAGSFSDLTLIKKRIQENKPWHQIAAEMGQSSEVLRIRFSVLEPWLRQGMGHRSSAVRSEAMTGFAKKVDGIFEAMVKDEPGLTLETVQGWYDQILLYSHRTRYSVIREREQEALLSTPTWTPEMDAKLLRMESEGRSWAAIEDELGRTYEHCLRRLHYAQKMKRRLHGLDGVTPHSSISQLHRHYDLLARQIWTPEIDEVIVRMWEGETESTWAMVGAVVGVDSGLCCNRYHTVLRPLFESVWSKSKTKRLHHLVGLGESWDTISSTLGLSKAACRMRWKETRNDAFTGPGKGLATSQRVAREVESCLYKRGRIERFYTCQDWDELLGMTSRTVSVQGWKRLQLDWLNQHSAWSERAENVLIQLVLRKGLSAWDEVAAAINTDARINLGKAMAARTVTAVECRMHWKNLDMPVQRSYDSRQWTASTRCSFWSAFSWCKMQQQDKEVMGGRQGYQQFWNKVAREMGMPGGGEQCLAFFEDSIRGLVALDDKTITDHANRQIKTLREKTAQQGLILRPKHWSLVFQDIVRQNKKSRLDDVEWRKVAAQMGDYPWSTHACTLDRDTNTSAFIDSIEWHWRHIHKNAGRPWSHSELKLLEQGIRECGFVWTEIWRKYLPWRTWSMMRTRWYRLSDCATRITVDEYMTLLQAVDEQQQPSSASIDWSKVVARMPEGWSMKPCRRAYESSYRHLLEQKLFTPEEDQWLLQNMEPQRNGSRDWKAAVDRFPKSGISAWQYRLRWCQLADSLVS